MGEEDRDQHSWVVEEAGRPCKGGSQSRQSAARRLGNVALAAANAIVTSDSGSCANWYARDFRVQQGQLRRCRAAWRRWVRPSPTPSGPSSPIPDRPVIALVGDGAMQMNNMAELITVQKYWKRWADPRWIVCVFNNQDLNEVTWEQRVMEGNPRFEASQDIPDFAYAKFGEMLGFKGIFVDISGPPRIRMAGGAFKRSPCRPGGEDRSGSALLCRRTSRSRRPAHSCQRWPKETEARAASSATPQDKSSTAYSAREIE